jgi:monoterpene epsilon-lactone hydrolase
MRIPPTLIRAGLRGARPLFETPRLPVSAKRRMVDVLSAAARPPKGTRFSRVVVKGVPVERVHTAGIATSGTLIYLHGGGYALGSALGYRGVVARLAAAANMDALIPDYSRSPEARFPVALTEMVAVYQQLLVDGLGPNRTVIAGDSAGGGLTLALAMELRDRGIVAPAALGLICPWADLAIDVNNARAARRDPLIVPSLTSEWSRRYVAEADPLLPGISPVYGDVVGLPPVIMHSSGDDPLAADAEKIDALFTANPAAGSIDHHQFEDLWHVFHLQAGLLAAADGAIAELGAALRQHVRQVGGERS